VAKKKKKKKGRSKFGQFVLLLVLVGILASGGIWNYRRNLEAESREPRPYKGYAEADLQKLVDAYKLEIDALAKRYERASGKRINVRDGGHISEQLEEFERVQRYSQAVRQIGYRLSEREAEMKMLEQERTRRVRDRDELRTFLRRVFTYQA
jgi:cell fate (sporulation/competence/biofilm development) regulator YlbF (YheA/YmcA/DUF963 family)